MNENAKLWLGPQTPYIRCQVLNTLEKHPELCARTILDLCEEGHYHEAVSLTEALEKQALSRLTHGEYITVRTGAKKVCTGAKKVS